MRNRIFLASSAILGAAAVYMGGVYYSGKVVDDTLKDLPAYVSANPSVKQLLDDFDLSYTEEESGVFQSQGKIQLTSKEDKELICALDLTITKKFLTSIINFDIKDIYAHISNTEGEDFFEELDQNSIGSKAYLKLHAFPESLAFHYDFAADYLKKEFKPLAAQFDVSVEGDRECKSSLMIKNAHYRNDGENNAFDKLDFKTSFTGFPQIRSFGEGDLKLEGFKSDQAQLGQLSFSYASQPLDKNGNFPLALQLNVDEVKGKLENLKVKLDFNGLNLKTLNEIMGKDDLSEEDQHKLLSGIRELKVEQFDFVLLSDSLKLLRSFVGAAPKKDKVGVKFNGVLSHDGSVTQEGLSGSFRFECDEDLFGQEFLVAEKDHYKADLEIKSGRVLLNGKEL